MKFLLMCLALLASASVAPSFKNVKNVNNVNYSYKTLYLEDAIDKVKSNNFNDVRNSLFSYGISYETNSNKKENRALEHISNNKTLHIRNNEYFTFKITANSDIEINTLIDSNNLLENAFDTEINYFVINDENENRFDSYCNPSATNSISSTSLKEDFIHSFYVKKGQTFYWKWGNKKDSLFGSHEFNISKSSGCGYKFQIRKDSYQQKEVKNEEYRYLDLIEQSATISGNDLIPGQTTYSDSQTMAVIGFRHGNVKEGNIQKFQSHTPTSLGIPNDNEPKTTFMQNWRMTSVNGDGSIVYIKALKKVRLNVSRQFLGNDALAGTTINIYKNNELIHSHEFSGADSKASDFDYSLVLDKDDIFYWEMIHYGVGFSIVSMGEDGTQYTSLPSFKAIEFGNIIEHTVNSTDLVNSIISSGNIVQTIEDDLGSIKVRNGQRELDNLVDANIGSNFVGSDNAKIKTNGEIQLTNSALTFEISTKYDLAVYLNFVSENNSSNLNLNVYQYVAEIGKTHRLYNIINVNDEKLSDIVDPLILTRNDIVYVEFISNGNSVNYVQFKGFTFSEKAIGDGLNNHYPIYEPNDYSSETTLTHKEIAFETARTRSQPIKTRDYDMSLVTGNVNESKKDGSYPFNYVFYESGEYLEGDIQPSMLLTGLDKNFDGDNFAAVEDYRIKTSKANSTIYKIKATSNTKLMLHHASTNAGWIKDNPEEKPEISFVYLQSNGSQYKQLDKKPVEDKVNNEDAFAYSFDLKQGDTAYLIFQSDAAYQRNLNIAFSFTSDPLMYNGAARDEIFSQAQTCIFSYDVISDMIKNNCSPVTYEDTLEVNFCHGDPKDPKQFKINECTGDGSGSAVDALYTGGPAVKQAGFQRWQIQAGKLSDNAIMIFKAKKNIHLTLKHDATKESWASFSSFKYFVVDTDNFFDYKEERYVSSDLEDDFFGYDIHLSQGQSLIISYQSNDESTHAVVDLVYQIYADTTSYNAALVNDFSSARKLDTIKQIYKEEIHNRFDSLDTEEYSLSNWSKIENYVDEFDKGIETLTTREEVIALYEKCINGINSILTKQQDQTLLEQTKRLALYQARMTIEENRHYFLDKTISSIEKRYSSLEWTINAAKSITKIKVNLLNFQTFVLQAPHDRENLKNGLAVGGIALAVFALGVAAITFVIKKNSNKQLLVVNRSITTLKLENDAEDLMPRKGLKWKAFVTYMKKYWMLYLMLVPMVVYLFIFSYIPMGGLSLAFKDFDFRQGIWNSPWATTNGQLDIFKYFKQLFDNPEFINSFLITLKISGLRLLCGFLIPIAITILLTEIKSKRFSKGFQIISYLPHFISWIVIYGILIALTTSGSPVQQFFAMILGKEVGFFSDPDIFLWLVIFSNIWKEAGWSTIIYFAAAASINPELYEAANIDGAKRWKRILKITLPGLIPAISINLILQASGFVFGGFDQIFALTGNGVNQSILPYVNITEIFLYKAGITSFEYSLATVVGLFNSVISFVLVLISNLVIKKIGGDGLW